MSSLASEKKTIEVDPLALGNCKDFPVPASEAELSRVTLPKFSVQVSVHSDIYILKGKTYPHKVTLSYSLTLLICITIKSSMYVRQLRAILQF